MLTPGHCLGVLGGGQLGRMFVSAATTMGFHTVVLDPDKRSPAGQLATRHIQRPYDSPRAIEAFTGYCDAVTLEFENIPRQTLLEIAQHRPTYPSVQSLEKTQDRCVEKTFLCAAGIDTVEFRSISDADAPGITDPALFPGILKTTRFGYDGKGQERVSTPDGARAAFKRLGEKPCILEEEVALEKEVSVIVVRAADNEIATYPVAENIHRNGILHASIAPARISAERAAEATAIARRIAERLDYRGVLGVEFFITRDGRLLVNEIAPRPHNSGHYTIDACRCSQFDQAARVMSEMPCGSTTQFSPVVMVNLLGEVWDRGAPHWGAVLDNPNIKLRLYGKQSLRSGRKMGHFCLLGDDLDAMVDEAERRWRRLAKLPEGEDR